MGLLSGHIEAKSQKILFKEAEKLGFAPAELDMVDLAQASGIVQTLATSILGGRSDASRLRRYQVTVEGRPAVFVRPFAGAIMHPGEIHTVVGGAPTVATALGAGGKWTGDARLAESAELAAALKKFSWRLQTHLVFTLPWALQVRSLGDGKSQLVMKSGSYAGLWAVTYGLAKFREIVVAVERALAGTATAPRQELALPCFGDLALETLRA